MTWSRYSFEVSIMAGSSRKEVKGDSHRRVSANILRAPGTGACADSGSGCAPRVHGPGEPSKTTRAACFPWKHAARVGAIRPASIVPEDQFVVLLAEVLEDDPVFLGLLDLPAGHGDVSEELVLPDLGAVGVVDEKVHIG